MHCHQDLVALDRQLGHDRERIMPHPKGREPGEVEMVH